MGGAPASARATGHALPLTAREVAGLALVLVGEPHLREQAVSLGLGGAPRVAAQLEQRADVLGGGERRQQVMGLEDEPDVREAQARQGGVFRLRDVLVKQPRSPPVAVSTRPINSSVVFPLPDGPESMTNSPGRTAKSTPFSAVRGGPGAVGLLDAAAVDGEVAASALLIGTPSPARPSGGVGARGPRP